MTPTEAGTEMARLSNLLDAGIEALKKQAVEYAQAEHAYRKLVSQKWLEAPDGTVPEREAWVKGETAKARERRDIADGMRSAALEAVRSRRAQVSAIQTLLNAEREGMAFERTGPEGVPAA